MQRVVNLKSVVEVSFKEHIGTLASVAASALLLLATALPPSLAFAQYDGYVPGQPHYATSVKVPNAADKQRLDAQAGELLVRAGGSSVRRSAALRSAPMGTAIEEALSGKVASVRSILKLPAVVPPGNQGGRSAQALTAYSEWFSVVLRDESERETACRQLKEAGLVDHCQRNLRHYINALPSDPLVTSNGTNLAVCAFDQTSPNLWGHQMVHAFEAWSAPGCPQQGCLGQGVVVGVVDTGIDYTHPDIVHNLFLNTREDLNNSGTFEPLPAAEGGDLDGIDNDGNGVVDDVVGANFTSSKPDPYDTYGHGTHCAGTIAATANNGIGIAGIAPGARILTAKGIGAGGYGTSEWLAMGLRYIVDTVDANRDGRVDRPTVINNSWGSDSDEQDLMLEEATRYAIAKGATVIFAAGNSRQDASKISPNGIPEAVMVAAVSPEATTASFSNYGDRIAVAAPGGGAGLTRCSDGLSNWRDSDRNIVSLLAAQSIFSSQLSHLIVGGSYIRLSGTSMAAPHVTGVVALLLSQRPGLTPQQVKNLLIAGTDPSRNADYSDYIGTGIVNAEKVLSLPSDLKLFSYFDRIESEIAPSRISYPVSGKTSAVATEVSLVRRSGYQGWRRQTLATVSGDLQGTLATIEPGAFGSQDELWIELVTRDREHTAAVRRRAYFDPTLREGFPRKITQGVLLGGGWYTNGQVAPLVADLSGNGEPRIILNDGSYDFLMVDRKGAVTRGSWSYLPGRLGSIYVADVKGRGDRQIIGVGATDRIYSSDGKLLHERRFWGWTDTSEYTQYKGTTEGAVIGVFGDEKTTAIVQRGELQRWYPNWYNQQSVKEFSTIHVLGSDLSDMPGWEGGRQLPFNEVLQADPLIGDMDGDSRNEIIIGPTTQGTLYRFALDGSLLSSSVVATNGKVVAHAVLGDLDGDGDQEVIYTTENIVHAVRADGTELAGWPVRVPSMWGDDYGSITGSVVLADITGDGRPEVLGSVNESYAIFAIRFDGTRLSNWAPSVGSYFGVNGTPVIGLIDGSGEQSVIYRSGGSSFIKVANARGEVVDSLSKRLGVGGYLTMPTVADIDNDGRNELIAIDEKGFLYIWDTQGSSCEASEWPTFGGDASRSRVYKHPRGDPYVFGCGATVEFKLVDSRGLPISGVAVSAGSLGRRISDVNGVVRFGGLPLGFHYSLSLESPVYSFSPVEGVVRGDEVVTVSGRAPELSLGGLIKDSDNQPISGVVVDGGPCGIAISGADGRFILPAGEYGRECQLQPKHPGVLFQQVSGITVSAASQEVVITGSWKHFSFLGRVVNRGRAISQATISLPGGRVLSANSQGRFRVRGIRYGTRLKMTVAAKGFKSRRVTVVVRSAQGVVVGLQRR